VQWLVLSKIVDQPGMSAGTLSETVGVHPSTLTPTLGRLEATGLIYIQERPTDLRRKMLLVSQRGFRKNQECVLLLTTLANEIKSTSFDLLDIDQVREVTGSLASSISGRLDHS
jgi:DNA-binding MarR family transcriptional regulator